MTQTNVMIKKISDNLLKFRNVTPPDGILKSAIIEILKTEFGIHIEKKHISVKNNNVFLFLPSVVKNELFLKKSSVLKKIQNLVPNRIISDIR